MGSIRSWRKKASNRLRAQLDAAERSGGTHSLPITKLGAQPNPGPNQALPSNSTNKNDLSETINHQGRKTVSVSGLWFASKTCLTEDAAMLCNAIRNMQIEPEKAQELITYAAEKAAYFGRLPDGQGAYEYSAIMRVIIGAAKIGLEHEKLEQAKGYGNSPIRHQHLHVHQQDGLEGPQEQQPALQGPAYLDGATLNDLAQTAKLLQDYGHLEAPEST